MAYYRQGGSDTNYSGLFTAGGDSLKTQVNSAGELVWAPHNLVTYSEDLSNASSWDTNEATATAGAVSTITDTVANDFHAVRANFKLWTNETGQFEVEVKAGTLDWCAIGIWFSVSSLAFDYVYVNLSTGAKGASAGTGASATVTDKGDGWYLVSISEQFTIGANRTPSTWAARTTIATMAPHG